MSRTADYTIKGFLYQFNKTLLEILNAEGGQQITVEGIIVTCPHKLYQLLC